MVGSGGSSGRIRQSGYTTANHQTPVNHDNSKSPLLHNNNKSPTQQQQITKYIQNITNIYLDFESEKRESKTYLRILAMATA
jgi:hypothetical protein